MKQINILNQEKIQHKMIIPKEKCFVAFKKLWESVAKEAHRLSIRIGSDVAIVT